MPGGCMVGEQEKRNHGFKGTFMTTAALSVTPPDPVPPSKAMVITRRAVAGWVMFDVAHTVYSMGVLSLGFPLYVRLEQGADRVDFVYGAITAVSMAVIFVLSPVLGAMSDRARRRVPFLMVTTVLCVVPTALIGAAGFWVSVAAFIFANIAFQAGTQFYDSLLPAVSTEKNRGRISGLGVGMGFIGSYIAVGIAYVLTSASPHGLFLTLAVVFALFTIPCFLFVRERPNPKAQPLRWGTVGDSVREVVHTFRTTREHPGLLRFLIARMFYSDAVNTVIAVMSLYVVNVARQFGGTEESGRHLADMILLFAITFAVLGGFFWGRIVDRIGPKRTLTLVLACWAVALLFGAAIGLFSLPLWTVYVMGAVTGLAFGGVSTSDRPFLLRLTPPDRVGEYYGLYGMVGRFAAITGPVLWAVVTAVARLCGLTALQSQAMGILVLLAMMGAGYVILRPVADGTRKAGA